MPFILFVMAAFGLLFTRVTSPTHAQQSVKQQPIRFPGVFVQDSAGLPKPLHIQTLSVDVRIRGTLATTTMEMKVFNPHNRILEGEFSFPIADGQMVSRFALDINGRLRDAVVVNKSKGRQTFEEVIRTKIDPALLEFTRDNSFRARVYPIGAKSTRRIVIAFEQQLTRTDNGFGYAIPFAFSEKVDSFSFHADVAAFGSRPSLAGDGYDTVHFSHRGRTFVADMSEQNILLDRPFMLTVPVVFRNHVVAVNSFDNESYFGAFLMLNPKSQPAALPNKVTLVWDASLSGLKRNHNKEQEFLASFFNYVQNVSVKFIAFANEIVDQKSFVVRGGDWSAIEKTIHSMIYDGGTQLGIAPLRQDESDLVLLMSDGISTFGEHKPMLGARPVYTISSGIPADHDVLRFIANESGGKYLDLASRSADDALSAILNDRLAIYSVNVIDGIIDDLRPSGSIEISEVTTITGKLRSPSATIEILTAIAGTVVGKELISISSNENLDSGSAMARLWAQFELQRLNANREEHANAIMGLGMRFGIVTPGTSLIVLDRLEDYVNFDVEPPSSEPMLVQQWRDRRRDLHADSLATLQRHKSYVSTQIKQRTDFFKRIINVDSVYRASKGEEDKRRVIDFFESRRADEVGGNSIGETGVRSPASASGQSRKSGVLRLMVPRAPAREGANGIEPASLGEPDDRRGVDHGGSIRIETSNAERKAWTKALEESGTRQLYSTYLVLRPRYEFVSSFYLDFSDRLREKGLAREALRVLSCLGELHGEDARDLRILGHRLLQIKQARLAVRVFADVMRIRDEEPQAYRDLALAHAATDNYQEAADLFVKIINTPWHARFPEIELIALTELNRLIAAHGSKINIAGIDREYLFPVMSDVRVVLTWDADNSDMDLWITDPLGDVCKYSQRDTRIGGHMSRDFTGGYGPEEFILLRALKGKYKVQVHYYGDRQQNLARSTTIQVEMYRNYGRIGEKRDGVTMRLDGVARVVDVGTITVN